MLAYHIMTKGEKEIISAWNYSGESKIYNMPSYKAQKERGIAFANLKCTNNYYSYYDENTLIGFTNTLEEANEVFIGIGVSPDICGRGYGQKILSIEQVISNELYFDKPLYLEVRTGINVRLHAMKSRFSN